MQAIESIPVFRTRSQVVSGGAAKRTAARGAEPMQPVALGGWEQLEIDLTLNALTSDLTMFAGAIVTDADLQHLQRRCTVAGLTLHTLPSGDNWYVSGVSPKRLLGKLIAGGAVDAGHYHYVIKPDSPLYRRTADHREYKQWIWSKIQDDDNANIDVQAALYEIINGVWVGCDVYVDGPNADVVVAAAGYLLNQYTVDGLPIITKGRSNDESQ